jgi:3-deoxy-7-phosphoheptulonate synthase
VVIVMKHSASADEIGGVIQHVESLGLRTHLSQGEERTIIGVIGGTPPPDASHFELLPGVERAVRIMHPYKLASRDFRAENTVVTVSDVVIGGPKITMMAGPCTVESREQLMAAAQAVKAAGAQILRGGAWKPRSSPYSFQGLGLKGLELLAEARERYHMPIVTEVMSPQDLSLVAHYADILQIGARNMNNFSLLAAVGEIQKPVLLKRGLMSTVEELLTAAEYILARGNQRVILCERGIRTFEPSTRNSFDVSAIPVLKSLTHLPVIADPSHSTGKRDLVAPVARAAIAAGADGLIIEVHPDPAMALCDGAQSLRPEDFARLSTEVRLIAEAVGRSA